MLVRLPSYLLFVITWALALAGAACAPQPGAVPAPTATASPTPTAAVTATATAAPTRDPVRTPTPAANIVIVAPTTGATITNPVRVTGKARVFEAALQLALKDGHGATLGTMPVTASMGAPEWGDFSAELVWDQSAAVTSEGRIEAFAYSPRDGAVTDLVAVPVTLPPRAGTPAALPVPARSPSPGPTRTP